ncbi:CDP-diacylglycerol-inositol 3-phosphatidyltransferase, putative [Theileria annulata]|uniref:CDP-diacylglycerol-inositol 3-phosphatidyltransferase, putative n=1 Tax=Theileria annulata TaxID=5874 RepID=Q4UFG8_THEAN|nr:CDP-diacylglycerol-inositol 3-phosphatidyltransferase, putative [Theileria annulata]CAI74148.1 CDP-diacylglycerol-inositol 3-phosphatidyltransferase, putative [Theileria annulata]|eukprot:XP_951880.1 CDP-diacylglycerol-inositol 3-phosphatidyltransferase, putative [Theileria annulata]
MEAKRPRLLNKPNFITSFRVVLFCTSFLYYKTKPLYFLGFYVSSVLLDMVDGEVARKYGEATIFGAMFDSLFDRMTTAFLYMHLSMKYPRYFLFFYFVLVWDVVGHWAHNYVCCLLGNTNHKKIDGFFLLKMYYEKRRMFLLPRLYPVIYNKTNINVRFLTYGSLPLAAFKAVSPLFSSSTHLSYTFTIVIFTNTAQFFYASKRLSIYEVEQFDLKAGAR